MYSVVVIVGTAALAGGAEGLAGISGKDNIEGTAEVPGIETAEVIPDRGPSEVSRALGGDEDRPRPFLPFDEGTGMEAGFGEHDAQIQASAARAEGQSMPGTWHHVIHRTPRIRRRSGVTRPRANIRSRMLLLITLTGR